MFLSFFVLGLGGKEMNMYYATEHLVLKVLPAYYHHQVLDFYIENKEHLEQWEAKREKNFYTPGYQKALLEAEFNCIAKGSMIRYYVFLKENPERIIGSASITNIQKGVFQNGTIGYKIHKEYCNRGFGKELVEKVKEIVFEECRLHKIEALVHPDNHPSIALLEATGFQREGLSREAAFLNEKWQDMYRYGCVRKVSG